ncbi:hypothetical protein ABT301_29095 [Streptomyces sp. NPDC000987]|uniref:hypothetical protein n=1 Tax=Streptomyces sp. NPDC000987 TaxID=3154374 RepID=UPI0033226BA9
MSSTQPRPNPTPECATQRLTATRVSLPSVIGPYDAHVELADHWNGYARPLFTLDTVRKIATDTQVLAEECGYNDAITAHVIDGDHGRDGEHRAVVLIVKWLYWEDGGSKKVTDIVEPTTYGLYGIGGSSWCWEFQTWDCLCQEKNPWHVTVCQCGELRDMQVAVPDGMRATRVCVDGLDAYPAFVAEHAQYGQRVTPYFTLDTVRQLATGTQEAAAQQHDPRSAETIHVLETAPDTAGNRGAIVLHTDWFTEVDEGPKDAVRTVVPNEHGLYPIGPDWHWRIAWWVCGCGNDNAWHDDQCSACGLTRAEQPKAILETASRKVGRLLQAQAPEATSALVDLTNLARIIAVYAGDTEIDTADDTGPFDTETLGAADAEIQQALEKAVIGDLAGAGWEPVEQSIYRITFGSEPTP